MFLHGNPHLDNYVKTDKGAAMIDFDRSRMGPYAWDLVRLLASIGLKKVKSNKFLSDIVSDYLLEGYIRSFNAENLPFKSPSVLDKVQPQKWQKSINDYLKSNNGWAKKLKENSISTDDLVLNGVLQSYLASRNESDLLNDYFIDKAALAYGTLQKKRYLVLLSPRKEKNGEKILLDLKSVYQDPDNEWYYNPFGHHGLRMIKAAEIYAPNIEERLGYATFNEEQYWGRAIPAFAYKIKSKLPETLQLDLAYSVGTQLGQAHRKSLVDSSPEELYNHLIKHYRQYVIISEVLAKEIEVAYQDYLGKLKKRPKKKLIFKVK